MSAAIRIGTRASALAMAQTRLAADAFEAAGARVEIVTIETAGDRRAADTPWGEGTFVGAIEQALRNGAVDVAVHSAKDMPTEEDARLRVVAYLPRADARDALVLPGGRGARGIDDLPAGSTIGTDSPRRTGFLRARRPDLAIVPLHGNVDTRLRRLDQGEVDGLVLAAAGLDRLERADRISQRFDAEELPPAPGQGAIAVQTRADDARLAELGRRIDHPATRAAVEAERAFLAATGGGCRAPVGALASVADGALQLLGGFATVDGRASAIARVEGPLDDAAALAERLAHDLVERRAALAEHRRVLLTRTPEQAQRLTARLAEHGLAAVVVPAVDIQLRAESLELQDALRALERYRWTVVTSANGARAAVEAARLAGVDLGAGRWAAVGAATAAVLRLPPAAAAWQPSEVRAEVLAEELPIATGDAVLLIRGNLADEALPARLRARGAEVTEVVAYETIEAPRASLPLLAGALEQELVAVALASPSAVRGILALAPDDEARRRLLQLPAVCIGPVTAAAARDAGFVAVAESPGTDASLVAEAIAQLVAPRPEAARVMS